MTLEFHPSIFATRELVTDKDHRLSHNNRLLYGDWLFDLFQGKTWAGLNFNWPDESTPVPDDRDRYIFSWHLDLWPYDWLARFADQHADQEIIVIGEYDDCAIRPNIRTIRYHCWHLVIPTMLALWNTKDQFRETRTRLLSCLCGKANFYRALVYSFMDQHFAQDDRVVVSWNVTKDRWCHSLGVLDSPLPGGRLEQLRQRYFQHDLSSRRLVIDGDQAKPSDIDSWNIWHFWDSNLSAYDTWINVTNESYCRSDLHDIAISSTPGPFISEKTWKALIQGLALVPNGMPHTYRHLTQLGFEMEYPWSMQFDQQPGDLDRLDQVLDTIAWILQQDEAELIQAILPSCRHNWQHVRSHDFVKQVTDINTASVGHFLASSWP